MYSISTCKWTITDYCYSIMHPIWAIIQRNGDQGLPAGEQVGWLQQHQAAAVRGRHAVPALHRQLQLQHQLLRRGIRVQETPLPR